MCVRSLTESRADESTAAPCFSDPLGKKDGGNEISNGRDCAATVCTVRIGHMWGTKQYWALPRRWMDGSPTNRAKSGGKIDVHGPRPNYVFLSLPSKTGSVSIRYSLSAACRRNDDGWHEYFSSLIYSKAAFCPWIGFPSSSRSLGQWCVLAYLWQLFLPLSFDRHWKGSLDIWPPFALSKPVAPFRWTSRPRYVIPMRVFASNAYTVSTGRRDQMWAKSRQHAPAENPERWPFPRITSKDLILGSNTKILGSFFPRRHKINCCARITKIFTNGGERNHLFRVQKMSIVLHCDQRRIIRYSEWVIVEFFFFVWRTKFFSRSDPCIPWFKRVMQYRFSFHTSSQSYLRAATIAKRSRPHSCHQNDLSLSRGAKLKRFEALTQNERGKKMGGVL